MRLFRQFIKPLFFSRRFYIALSVVAFLFVLSFWFSLLYVVAQWMLGTLLLLVLLDYFSLFRKKGVEVQRITSERYSNGDQNRVTLHVSNRYSFRILATVIDEMPVQFQRRDFSITMQLKEDETVDAVYHVRPVDRGEYIYRDIHVFVKSPLRLAVRRFSFNAEQTVKVLPSFFTLRHYEIKAHASNVAEAGNKRIRKLGSSLEFEQIKEYVLGDDIRTIHWKATARKGQLMVNNYTDERSQQIYCILDKGRVMKMPFNGMSLLDYAINATLVLSKVALIKQDKAGIITFSEQPGNMLVADRRGDQMNSILNMLYAEQTRFQESDYEKLYALMRARVTQRSLVILFTNFESMSALNRQLPFIRSIAKYHLVLIVFFENTELRELTESKVENIEDLYIRTIAEKFAHEKRLIVKELQKHGILTILTTPEKLTVDAVNKYLELKARQAI